MNPGMIICIGRKLEHQIGRNLDGGKILEHSIKFSELATTKITVIHVEFEHPEIINEFRFKIASPELFNRRARIYVLNEREVKHKLETYKQVIASFVIHSDLENNFIMPSFFGRELYLEIENQDNPKLTIESLNFFQTTWYAVANLKQNDNYTASAGNKKLSAPKYDISSFRKNISESLPKSSIVAIKLIKDNLKVKAILSIWQQPWFMWLCIGFAAVIIAFFSTNLIKDLKK